MARWPAHIKLTEAEETTLREWCRRGKSEQRTVDRARIILLSHEGLTVENIAKQLGTRPARVSKWRQRFAKDRLAALSDAPRSGRPCIDPPGRVSPQPTRTAGAARSPRPPASASCRA